MSHAPAEPDVLAGRRIHIWQVRLDEPPAAVASLAQALSDDERTRADAFVHERDRARFVVGRAALRHVLARYVPEAPGGIAFRYGPRGKPELSPPAGTAGPHFNTSHSDGIALVAVSAGVRVGIDVERLRAVHDALDIAGRFFTPAEAAALRAAPEGRRQEAFFRCWTRKEAYLKALGEGLAVPLDAFEVSAASEPAALRSIVGTGAETAQWSLRDLDPAPGYVGALAFEGPAAEVSCRRFESLPGTA